MLLGFVVLCVEGGAYAAIRILGPRVGGVQRTTVLYREQTELFRAFLAGDPSRLEEHDPVLGWGYRAGFTRATDHINTQGLRSMREYAAAPPPEVLRVAVYGDSFTYGNEVADADAWPAQLEAGDATLEVLNYGVGGYGTDQALLRYERDGDVLAPHVVVIGFAPMDIRRVVNVYRRFIAANEGPWIKPRFRLRTDGTLELIPNPAADPAMLRRFIETPAAIRDLGAHDAWYTPAVYANPLYDWSAAVRLLTTVWVQLDRRYLDAEPLLRGGQYNPKSDAFAIQIAVFERFVGAVRASGAIPVVLLLPDRGSVETARRGTPTIYAPLREALLERGIRFLDAVDAFTPARPDEDAARFFMPGGHYSPVGNERVATWLAPRIPREDAPPRPVIP